MAPLLTTIPLLFTLLSIPKTSATNLLSFGDSYTTTMFNSGGPQPNAQNPLGNPDFPGVSLAGGPSWLGHLLGDHPYDARGEQVYAWNFANTGAIVNITLQGGSTAIDFVGQMQWLKDMNAEIGAEDYVSVFFGTNDIKGAMTVQDAMIPQIIEAMFDLITELRTMGARKFVIFSMDPLDRTPTFSVLPYSLFQPLVKAAVAMWNENLSKAIANFQIKYPDCTIGVVETAPLFHYIMDNPRQYGVEDNLCENTDGTTCLWWDNLHPGQAFQRAMAAAAFDAFKGVGLYGEDS